MPMNYEVKAKWVAALRSGEYKQGRHKLRKPHDDASYKFCCLGVLCDLYLKNNGIEDESVFEGSYLPDKVRDWAGLGFIDPRVFIRSAPRAPLRKLSDLNDGGHSFNEIASLIERHL